MEELPILFNVSKNGKTQFWRIYIKDGVEIYRESWYQGGKVRTFPPIICTPKNVNKANETSIEEQTKLECKSKWTAQMKKGYAIYQPGGDVKKTETQKQLLPMLAQKFTERQKYINLPCGVSRKLDGVRMIATLDSSNQIKLTSRTSKEFYWMNTIRKHLYQIYEKFPGIILDGEIYSHTLPFSILCGAVRSVNSPSMYDDVLEYWIFDIADESKTYKERVEILKQIKEWYDGSAQFTERCIKFELYETIQSFDVIQKYHDEYVSQGFEGLIIRNLNGLYKFKYRTNDLQKYKNFEDSEFEIVNYKAGQGTEKGAIVFECKMPNSTTTFDVRPRGSIEDRIKQYQKGQEYIGKKLSVRYQPHVKTSDQLKDDLPRFPVGIEIRDYE